MSSTVSPPVVAGIARVSNHSSAPSFNLLRPEVAAANSNFVYYANANARATSLLEEDLRNDPGIYPTPEVKARLHANLARSPAFTRALNRSWTRFVTGR